MIQRSHFTPDILVSAPSCGRNCQHFPEGNHGCSYRVAWKINPSMQVGAASPVRAVMQHDTFVKRLRALGAQVQTLPFVHGAYDSVFVKDSAVVVRRRGAMHALLTNPKFPQRKAEQASRHRAFGQMGALVSAPPTAHLEGGDVVLRSGVNPHGHASHSASGRVAAFMGTGFRSSPHARDALERFLNAPVVTLELIDPRLYHLDMALACLPDDQTVIVCEEALAKHSMAALASTFHPGALVRITLAEALNFAANVVVFGKDVVVGAESPRLAGILRERGYRIHVVDLHDFHLAGGSAACLVSQIRDQECADNTTAAMRSTAA